LDEKTLCHKLKVLCFVPEDYHTRHRANFEEATGYRVTENQTEAERAAWEGMDEEEDMEAQEETAAETSGGTFPSVDNAFRGLPLRERLQEVMKRRKVSGAALAPLFGVSKMTVSNWISGKKPIPRDAVPLLVRWIESGTAPTAEELAARRSRRDET
jgi:DNA-binding transcriptional regulator YiaG